ncbi:MAG: amidophosphoribosyltransferase [Nitrospirota bacterium]
MYSRQYNQYNIPLDNFNEECALFGIYGHPEASMMTYLGLYALQHRGQEGTGIVSSDGSVMFQEKGMGLVKNFFYEEQIKGLPGYMAIGHNRYSTTGESHSINVQPLTAKLSLGSLALCHNGNLTNVSSLRDELESYGAIFQTTVDSEVVIHLIAHSKEGNLLQKIIDAAKKIRGAFCLLFLCKDGLIGVRDPYGVRPLSLGKLKDSWILASESCAFDVLEGSFVRDIEPGEIVVINKDGVSSYKPFPEVEKAQCIFEYIYFSRPDSYIFGNNVYSIRKNLGRELASETSVDADIVIPVPDSGIQAALGYAEGAGLLFETGLIRSHYVGRTFIQPHESLRHFGVKIKLNAVKDILNGKRVVVVDDSIVRGTTSRKIIKMIRDAGAKEVHLRISSSPILFSCFYGIDTPTRDELIANNLSIEEIRRFITADSVRYLSAEGMLKAIPASRDKFCLACFKGNYPIPGTKAEM